MGNQQERSYSWLAGILDGEGTISFQVYTMPDGRVRITPFICVVNSDDGILTEAEAILAELAKACDGKVRYCNHTEANTEAIFTTRKKVSVLRVDGRAAAGIAKVLHPYLRSTQKRAGAEALIKYQDSRDAGLIQRDERGRILRKGYTQAEVELVCSVRSHKNAKSSEAICSAPNVLG